MQPTYRDFIELDYIHREEISVIHLAIIGEWTELIEELREIHTGGN